MTIVVVVYPNLQKLRFDVRILAYFTQLIKERLFFVEIANLVQVVKKWLSFTTSLIAMKLVCLSFIIIILVSK